MSPRVVPPAPKKTLLRSLACIGSTRTVLGLLGGMAVSAVLAACGRPATQQDCELIIDRNVELQMKQMQITDPATIEKRKNEIRQQMGDQLKGCVGKRVTNGMMACVKQAQSADEIDQCLR